MTAQTATPTLFEDKQDTALRGLQGYVPLTPEEEAELAGRCQDGDLEAGWTLVMANQAFVRLVVRRYQRRNVDNEELVAEGLMGLFEAAKRFRPELGHKFVTYGVWWVRRAILRQLRQSEHAVHVPKYKVQELQEYWRAHAKLANELRRNPDLDELVAATGATPDQIREYQGLSSSTEALDDTENNSLAPLLSHEADPETRTLNESGRERMLGVFHVLSPREQFVLNRRFGLDGEEPQTLSAVGETVNLTKERIRQIEVAATRKLNRAMEDPQVSAAVTPLLCVAA